MQMRESDATDHFKRRLAATLFAVNAASEFHNFEQVKAQILLLEETRVSEAPHDLQTTPTQLQNMHVQHAGQGARQQQQRRQTIKAIDATCGTDRMLFAPTGIPMGVLVHQVVAMATSALLAAVTMVAAPSFINMLLEVSSFLMLNMLQ